MDARHSRSNLLSSFSRIRFEKEEPDRPYLGPGGLCGEIQQAKFVRIFCSAVLTKGIERVLRRKDG